MCPRKRDNSSQGGSVQWQAGCQSMDVYGVQDLTGAPSHGAEQAALAASRVTVTVTCMGMGRADAVREAG